MTRPGGARETLVSGRSRVIPAHLPQGDFSEAQMKQQLCKARAFWPERCYTTRLSHITSL